MLTITHKKTFKELTPDETLKRQSIVYICNKNK